MSYVGRKSGNAALIAADIPSNLNLLGSYVKIPSVTTANLPGSGDNSSITPVNGMLVYNSTLGRLQQRAGGVWSEITSAPVITSFVYSDGASATAENPAGGGVITVTGTNFDSTAAGSSANVGLTFGGTTATSISVNSSKTVITATVPAKAAGTVTMKVINASGLTAETNFIYDTEPVFSTAEAIGSFADGVYTANAFAPRIVASEGADTITYARVTSLTDDTVISTTIAGLTLGSTGYLTGTLAGTNATTYPFYAQATDAENQNTPKLFNIISYDYAATGGIITTYSGYRVHKFILGMSESFTFTVNSAMNVDYLVVAGGGGGGAGYHGGGGGAGGFRTASGFGVTAQAYTITVGAYGAGQGAVSGTTSAKGGSGGASTFSSITATGGGGGATYWNGDGLADGVGGGSGGGAGTVSGSSANTGGTGINDGSTFGTSTYQGHAGGDNNGYLSPYSGAGGGGAGTVGTAGGASGALGYGGTGEDQVMGLNATDSYTLLTNASAGHVVSAARYFAGGGAGGTGDSGLTINGGSGGGGAGGSGSGSAGTANTGGGGGAGGGSGGVGSNGGSGIVIIRYAV
jgi:hypothetical protein